jgi:4-cresol dehydrogenase (hydroxylating)
VIAAKRLMQALAHDASALGLGEYRTHIRFMTEASSAFDFNDHALRRLNERVKDALDPAGILAPGKSGIWPRKYRE